MEYEFPFELSFVYLDLYGLFFLNIVLVRQLPYTFLTFILKTSNPTENKFEFS